MANDIKAGDTFGDFRVTSVTTLHEQGETAVMLSHGPTGLQWLHFLADDPVSSCAIGIVTPVTDDCGLPHVLEHMIFTGSKKHPGTDLMRGMMNRTVALRDPLTFKKVRKMARFGSDSVKARQTMLRDKVWATGDTAEKSLLNACSDCRALGTLLEYRMGCARPRTPQPRDEMAAAFVREASETADLLHNPARWTFALEGPKHLTDPLRESLLETLLAAPARPIGPVAELKFAPKKQSSEKREAKSVPGSKVATISVSIPAPAESALLRRRLEIGALLLERDFAEPRIRKGLGAYVACCEWKENFLRLESRQNPDVGDTLGIVRDIRDFVAGVKWTAEDVRQATLHMAAGFVNQSRSASILVSRCLENHICGEKPTSIRGELERIAKMDPEEIRETLLEALDAGMGHETISVKASEEAIAEANLALTEELRLHVAEAS